MQTVSVQAIPNQTMQVQLGGQAVTLNVYQYTFGLFMDVLLGATKIATCIPCQNLNRIVRYGYLGFLGDFVWFDTQGTDDPLYTGLGSRWLLLYLSPADLASLASTTTTEQFAKLVQPTSIATASLSLTAASSQVLNANGNPGINRQKFTISCWFKTPSGGPSGFYSANDGTNNNRTDFTLQLPGGQIGMRNFTAGVRDVLLDTAAGFADGQWHHALLAVDTTQATASNRVLFYVDAVLITNLVDTTYPSLNQLLSNNYAMPYAIGAQATGVGSFGNFFNGNLAQFYYIDGQVLTPVYFVAGSPIVPRKFAGKYTGVFDFFLPFNNAALLGADGSGEGNNWTPVNGPVQSPDHP